MARLMTVAQMREADARTMAAGTPGYTLMQRAGAAVAECAAAEAQHRAGAEARIVVLCGPGNNGGDGFVAARLLAARGFTVRLALLGDAAALKGDAAEAAADWSGDVVPAGGAALAEADVIVEALFGAGLDRELEPDACALVERINASGAFVVAVDIPAGVDGDSGAVLGAAVKADATVTFVAPKPGHYLLPGRLLRGRLMVADIGIDGAAAVAGAPPLWINRPDNWRGVYPVPAIEGHKYGRGHVLVLSGGAGRSGAARLAARAALRIGAGLVTVGAPPDAIAENAAHLTAIMLREVSDAAALSTLLEDTRFNAVLAGPGAGAGEKTRWLVEAACGAARACVLDADALTSFAGETKALRQACASAAAQGVVLTPHEGEFARLFAHEPQVLAVPSRLERARRAAALTGAVVVLKGPDTVIAAPDGRAAINDNGSPWLATAGSGDVLGGFIAGLLAQHMPAFEAACAGVWLHGDAGSCAGPGLIAEDLPELMPQVLKTLLA